MKWADRAHLPALGCLFGVLVLAAPVHAQTARVLAVTDGDTVVLERGGRQQTVDLAGIDAPELTQPHGPQARGALGTLLLGHLVRVAVAAGGATLVVNGEDVATRLVREGHAWVTPGPQQVRLAPLEQQARQSRLGLWQGSAAIPPWDWRQGVRTRPSPALHPAGFVVGNRDTRRYYPPGCAATVPQAARTLFGSAIKAKAAGFRLAPECGKRR